MATNISHHPHRARAIGIQGYRDARSPWGELGHKPGHEHLIKGCFQRGPKQFSNAAISLLPHTLILLETLTY